MPFVVPTTPVPAQVQSGARHVLTLLAGGLAAHGYATQSVLSVVISAVLFLLPFGWAQLSARAQAEILAALALDPSVPQVLAEGAAPAVASAADLAATDAAPAAASSVLSSLTPMLMAALLLGGVGLGGFGLVGCAGTAAIVTQLTTQTPAQVTTLAEAEQAATLVTKAADLYVTSGAATPAQLAEIGKLSDAVHVALTALEADQTAGKSLVFDGFNAALAAFNAWQSSTGAADAASSATTA